MIIIKKINADTANNLKGINGNIRLRKINPFVCEIYSASTGVVVAKGFFYRKYENSIWRIMMRDDLNPVAYTLEADRVDWCREGNYDFQVLGVFI